MQVKRASFGFPSKKVWAAEIGGGLLGIIEAQALHSQALGAMYWATASTDPLGTTKNSVVEKLHLLHPQKWSLMRF